MIYAHVYIVKYRGWLAKKAILEYCIVIIYNIFIRKVQASMAKEKKVIQINFG